MNMREAFEILIPPLIFGNPTQIAAVRFIEKVDEAQLVAQKCDKCYGGGAYIEAGDLFQCECVADFSNEVVQALALRTSGR